LANPDLPFGGVGYSGYGKYHGFSGFRNMSNEKAVLVKPALNIYPYTKVLPPFTSDKQSLIRVLVKAASSSQLTTAKRFSYFLILVWILRGVMTGKINANTWHSFKRFFMILKSHLMMMMGP